MRAIGEAKLFREAANLEERVRQAFASWLEPADGSSPANYFAALRRRLDAHLATFPSLARYVEELEWSLDSEWFWPKQASILHAMRQRSDFRWTFDPIGTLAPAQANALLQKLGAGASYAELLTVLFGAWDPQPSVSQTRPFRIRVGWMTLLRSGRTPPLVRFTVALRLGLGRPALSSGDAAAGALESVPRRLRHLDNRQLLEIAVKVADTLGAHDAAGQRHRTPKGTADAGSGPGRGAAPGITTRSRGASSAGTDTPSPVADVVSEAFKRQSAHLGAPIPRPNAEEAERLEELSRRTKERLERWLAGQDDDDWLPAWRPETRGVVEVDGTADERPRLRRGLPEAFDVVNVAKRLDFGPITHVVRLPESPAAYAALARSVSRHARRLRADLAVLGSALADLAGHRTGRRLDPSRGVRLATMRDPGVLVGLEERPAPDLFLGLAIDASGSMMTGDRMARAQAFAVLLLEAVRRLDGLGARAIAFTDAAIVDLGGPGRSSVAALEPGGGNNDAAALAHLGHLALASGYARRVLVMISDGFPSECSLASLSALVRLLTRQHRCVCVQVAVAELEADRVAFPHFVDLTRHTFDGAVMAFGRMIRRVVQRHFGD